MKLFEKRIEYQYIYGTLLGTAIHFSCNHPHISKIENVEVKNQVLLIRMKHVDYKLNDVRHNKRMLYQLVQAVKYLYDNGIVHCDIKHENVLVDGDCVLLNDFGASTYSGYSITFKCDNDCIHLPLNDLKTGIIDTKFDIHALGCLFRESYERNWLDGIDDIDFDLFYELILKMTYKDKARRCDINFVEQHPFFDGARLLIESTCVKPFKLRRSSIHSGVESLLHAGVLLDYMGSRQYSEDLYKLARELMHIVFEKKQYSYNEAINISHSCKMLACVLLDDNESFNLKLAVQSIGLVLEALYR